MTQFGYACIFFQLLLTPEGTRFTPKKHEASIKFAMEKNLPILKHHLTPRTRGFTTSLPFFREKIPAIYNIQLAFDKSSKVCYFDFYYISVYITILYNGCIVLKTVAKQPNMTRSLMLNCY